MDTETEAPVDDLEAVVGEDDDALGDAESLGCTGGVTCTS